jgi:N-acetylglucosamine-6-phosphate deacetylase
MRCKLRGERRFPAEMEALMGKWMIYNVRLYSESIGGDLGWISIEDKRIATIAPGLPPQHLFAEMGKSIDGLNGILLPGFIDLHVHGAMGFEVMDASVGGLHQMAQFFARHGVTGFLATTWTATTAAIHLALDAVKQTLGRVPGGASILGAHLEGPYLNSERCGAQDPQLIRRAEKGEALGFLDSGVVRLLALAPEYPENLWLIDECVRRGITVSAGHTDAGLEAMQRAVDRGLSQVTHCFNGMKGFNHREPGTVGAALALPGIRCELIADNIHVHPAAQKILVDVKTPSGVVLITDAIRGAGLADGDYKIDSRVIQVRNGEARLASGSLAGSVLTMERALKNACHASGRPLSEVWIMSSLNAARAIGIADRKGSLAVGKDADLVLCDDEFQVIRTVIEGETVYSI